ncbi:DUF4055 domain-containing protein [Pseudomonas capsici]|uniref:DUF4055 domain-containing protein n=1 Tax=Pseudomonas capsici TaxID=2810614 RepID=UPI0021F1EF06|nr:DUF4055 domain-containing protein [Pseudomonas capsici]MCV4274467.1 DUF4055 domain-containing protein [Pseudomonas capsici]
MASGELFAHPLGASSIYQESSDQWNILRIARVPVLFASGVAEDALIAIGSEYAIKGESGADLKYVEHSGAAIGAGRDSLKDLEAKMQSYGSDMLGNNGAVETALVGRYWLVRRTSGRSAYWEPRK